MRKYEDTYFSKGFRKRLVDILREKGITDEQVLMAINTIPRHYFLDSAFDKIAYETVLFNWGRANHFTTLYRCYQTQLCK